MSFYFCCPIEGENTKESASEDAEEAWRPAVSAGTSVSGIVGGILTLVLAAFTGLLIYMVKKRKRASA